MTREEAINEIKSWDFLEGKEIEAINTLIPELAESVSEDERTRRGLIKFISDIKSISESGRTTWAVRSDDAKMCETFLAYLEKQKDASKAIEAVDRIDKYIDEQVANAHDMKDSNPDKKYYQGWDDALGEMAGILQDVYSNEKQKEQKHYWKPTETDVALFNKAVTTNKTLTPAERAQLDIIRSKFGCCRAANCSGIVQKEQKPQYIYLKFREGDIIQKITGGDIVTIAEVDTDAEEYRLTNSGFIPFKYEHLWYLIEQKPAEWSEEDETKLRDVVRLVEDSGHVKSIREHYEKFLTSLPERFNLCPEQEWSEEDEEMRNLIITIFEVNHPDGFFKANELGTTDMRGVHTEEIISWLKSLRPQPKQEWSEEDERNLCRAIFYVIGYQKNNGVTNETKECKDWLEFLRLRSRWKPSKEQIDLLRKVYNLIWADPATPADIQDGLGDFIEQLKTL